MKHVRLAIAGLILALILLGLILGAPTFAALVPDVVMLVGKGNLPQAEMLISEYQKTHGDTPEMIEAYSWLGRGALAMKRYDLAEMYAAQTRRLCIAALKTRRIDAEPHLPTALGASIEVHGKTLAALGKRSEGISYLKQELASWRNTSIETRIYKNINELNLVGSTPPPLQMAEWLGPKPPSLSSLKGKPVLLFFWAHWCADCKMQGPSLAVLKQKYASQGLVLVAPTQRYGYVANGDEAPPAKETPYIDQVRHVYYAPLLDVPAPLSAENFKIYGVSTTPTLVLLDRNGIVRMYHPGEMAPAELEAQIKSLL